MRGTYKYYMYVVHYVVESIISGIDRLTRLGFRWLCSDQSELASCVLLRSILRLKSRACRAYSQGKQIIVKS